MALSPNGKTIASGSLDGTVRLWDVETGKVVVKWMGHAEHVKSVCWSPDGEQVASGSFESGTAGVWDAKNGKPVKNLNPIETWHDGIDVVSYSPKSTMIAIGGNYELEIWDAKTGELLNRFGYKSVWSLAWTSDQKKLVFESTNASIGILDTATWQQIAILEGHKDDHGAVSALILFPNNRLLASTSWDHTARLWNLDTNLPVGPPLQHENDVECAAFSADGNLLFTGCDDENAYVWDVRAILKAAGLEDLLTIPDKSELKKKSLSSAKATRRPVPRRVPPGFFNDAQDHDPFHHDPSLHRRQGAAAPSWGSHPRALLARIPKLFRRSQPNTDEQIQLQQRPVLRTLSRRSPPVVEVPALDDKKALYVAPPRGETASDKAKHIKNPKWWVRVVLFLCCVAPTTDDGPTSGTNKTQHHPST